jgi:heptosyltransferase-2
MSILDKRTLHIHYIMTHGIGDVIMTIPVLKKIGSKRSVDFSITVNTETEAAVIRELCPDIRLSFFNFGEILNKSGYLIAVIKLIKYIRSFSPDIVLTQFDITSYKSSIVSFLSGAKFRVGWKGWFSFLNTHTLIPSGLHKLEENLKVLQVLNIAISKDDIKYPVYNPDINKINQPMLQSLLTSDFVNIAIGPGSKELDKHKRWPKENFSLLINKFLDNNKNYNIILLGNNHEKNLCADIANNIKDKQKIWNLAGQVSITELITILGFVDLTITNCNGISHLACVASNHIIGLYGPTNYKITGPISDKFIPVTADLECSPCFSRDYETGCGNPICMERIMVDDVYAKAISLLSHLSTVD